MTVYFDKARGRWRYDFWRAKKRYVDYCINLDGTPARNKTEAEKAEERAKAATQIVERPRPPATPTLAMAIALYEPTLPDNAFGDDRRAQLIELGQQLGLSTPLVEIEGKVKGYIAWARTQKLRIYIGGPRAKARHKAARPLWRDSERLRSDSTINRYLDALRRAVGDFAATRDPATGLPRLPFVPKIEKLREVTRIPRPVPDSDLAAILAKASPWVVDAATLIRHMGFRKAELMTVPLDQVDLERRGIWLVAEATKGKRDEFVPANETAMAILRRRVAQARMLGVDTLFWYVPRGKTKDGRPKPPQPIADFKSAWRGALKRAGLAGRRFRIHDLKASFVTAIAEHASAATTQKLARHKSFETTQRYLSVVDPAARAAVDAISVIKPGPTPKSHTKKRAAG